MFDPVDADLSANQDTRDHEACHIGQVRWDPGRGHWLATRYADVKRVLTDPRFGFQAPADDRRQDGDSPDPRLVALFRQMRQQQLHWMPMSSPPDHTRIRAEFGPFFSRERVD